MFLIILFHKLETTYSLTYHSPSSFIQALPLYFSHFQLILSVTSSLTLSFPLSSIYFLSISLLTYSLSLLLTHSLPSSLSYCLRPAFTHSLTTPSFTRTITHYSHGFLSVVSIFYKDQYIRNLSKDRSLKRLITFHRIISAI